MLPGAPSLEQLIEAFRRLPGVGKRSAERMALHLLSIPEASEALEAAVHTAREALQRGTQRIAQLRPL